MMAAVFVGAASLARAQPTALPAAHDDDHSIVFELGWAAD
jgi:hypothetical protein